MMTLTIKNLDELPTAARRLVPALRAHGGVVAMYGGMGAGKTTLVAALVREMGSADTVTSPTFAIVNDYLLPGGGHIYHFDFYRIDDVREAFDLGYEEYFYGGELCLVEWPEKVEQLLPENALILRIEAHPDGRRTITVR
jgi:tRNA threonylcarbamoyladenosine biosynthesis protein TsaE